MDSSAAFVNARDGIELCDAIDGFRDPEGVPGRDGVGVICLECERER